MNVNASDNFEDASTVMVFQYSIGALTLIVAPVLVITVLFQSNLRMTCHRRFVLSSVPFGLITSIGITFAMPTYDVSDKSIRFHGALALIEYEYMEPLLTAVFLVCSYISSDILLIMLINRYDIVSKKILKPSRWTFRGAYVIIVLSNGLQSALSTITCYHHDSPHGLKLSYQPIDDIFKPIAAMYFVTRAIAFVYTIYLNIDFRRVLEIRSMPNVIRFHKMVVKAIIANVIVQLLFTQGPMIVAMVAVSSNNVSLAHGIVKFVVCSFNCAFLGCMLVTLYFVKPYRKFLFSLFGSINNVMPLDLSVSNSALRGN